MKKRIGIFLILLFLLAPSISGASSNSSSYNLKLITVSEGGGSINSSTYKNTISMGIINWVINSSTYISRLGFLYGLLLADGQPCTTANQCEGGYCCSSVCASSACAGEEEPEAPAEAAAAGGGGGGGGLGALVNLTGVGAEKERDYSVSHSSIKSELVIGRSKENKFKIENTGEERLDFSLSIRGVEEFISLSDNSFSLDAGESKTITVEMKGEDFGAYSGKIIITAGGIVKEILLVIEVKSDVVLFDVKMDIPSDYKEVERGEDLKAQITLLNVGVPQEVDVIITYLMKDFTGNVIYESSETFAVDKQRSYVKNFPVSSSTELGDYLAVIEVRYSKSFAVSSEMFKVVEKPVVTLPKLLKTQLYNIILLIAIAAIVWFLFISKLIPKKASRRKK